MVRRNGSCWRRRERVNEDGDVHAVIATVGPDEVITFRLVKRHEVLAAAPVLDSAVVLIRLVRSEGGVLSGIARRGEALTDEVTDVESVVVGPECIVDSRVPAAAGSDNVVSFADEGDDGSGDAYE
uniref:Uncharacterized protein n=1 Tax=Nelumbo nucifera TaxID=4432 RepID=A0A822YZN7_NELNU|nr:TPA_asm: hypothetical protein HUJ06_008823 [Nelumbo nucifera]